MIRIAICDDEIRHGTVIEKSVSLFLEKNKVVAKVIRYDNSQNLHFDISEGTHYDLLLSDIEMPGINGMELAKVVKKQLPDLMIIFITSHVKYAVDAYTLSVFRYIPKGELSERLFNALSDAINMLQLQMDKYYTIQTATRYEKIPLKKIVFIRRESKNAIITQTDGATINVRQSLAQIYSELNTSDFLFVGRGDIVNIVHIANMKNGIIELISGERIPVSQSNLAEIKGKLNDYWGRKI